MSYSELTTDQQTQLQAWLALLRPWTAEQAKANNHGGAIDTAYNADISAILSDLSGSDEIPNTTSAGGATALTKDEAISIVSHIQGIRTNYNTSAHRQLWSKACGAANLIG